MMQAGAPRTRSRGGRRLLNRADVYLTEFAKFNFTHRRDPALTIQISGRDVHPIRRARRQIEVKTQALGLLWL